LLTLSHVFYITMMFYLQWLCRCAMNHCGTDAWIGALEESPSPRDRPLKPIGLCLMSPLQT
jgi:hypothetical protein